jgi:hypothetical protein
VCVGKELALLRVSVFTPTLGSIHCVLVDVYQKEAASVCFSPSTST